MYAIYFSGHIILPSHCFGNIFLVAEPATSVSASGRSRMTRCFWYAQTLVSEWCAHIPQQSLWVPRNLYLCLVALYFTNSITVQSNYDFIMTVICSPKKKQKNNRLQNLAGTACCSVGFRSNLYPRWIDVALQCTRCCFFFHFHL